MNFKVSFVVLSLVLRAVATTAETKFDWTILDTKLPKAVSDHTATRAGDTVYIAGGCDAVNGNSWDDDAKQFFCLSISKSLFAYNLETNAVTSALPDMPVARYRHAAVAANDKIWLVGGRDEVDNIVAQVDVYDINTNKWSTVGNLTEEYLASDHTGFGWENRYAYFIGGYNQTYAALPTVFSFDATATAPLSTLTQRAPLLVERGDISSAVDVLNGQVLVAGGFTHKNDYCEPHDHAELYNVVLNQWTEVAAMGYARADKAMVHLDGESGIFYSIGGERQVTGFCELDVKPEPGERTIPIDQVERFDQKLNQWTDVADLPVHRFRFPAVSKGNNIYTFGGQISFEAACECFKTTADIIVYTEQSTSSTTSRLLMAGTLSWTLVCAASFLLGIL